MEFAIIDIETSGGKPKDSKIIEIAIIIHNGHRIIETYESLVYPEKKIDWYVSKLTGIKDKDVKDAPKFYEIAKKVFKLLENRVFVAHNVSFDYPIVRNEFKQLGLDLRLPHMCTIQASRLLIPNLESYSLKNLSQHLKIDLDNHHRAMDDTKATAIIFEHIFKIDEENKLASFIKQDVNPSHLHPLLDLNYFDDIPNKVGVYKFFNDKKEIIYIGKSKHLKKRIEQHLKNTQTNKAIKMRSEIARIQYDLCGNELIALLIESNLIKKIKPKYNTAQKNTSFNFGLYKYTDQKGYTNLMIKKNEITTTPLHTFKSIKAGKDSLESWKNEFNLCQKLCHLFTSNNACFDYGINNCKGACIGEESPELYNIKVNALINKLNFNNKSFLILDKGKRKNEVGFVVIQNGEYKGYGNILKFLLKKDALNYKKQLKTQDNNPNCKAIINLQLKTNKKLEILEF